MNSFLLSAMFILVYFLVVFAIGQKLKNNAVVDVAWGLGFVLIAWLNSLVLGIGTFSRLIMLLLISVWGLRLSYHIFKRNHKKPEDFRYQQMRAKWKGNQALNALLKVYLLQGAIMYVVALPIMFVFSTNIGGLTLLSTFAILLWVVGFVFEAVGDWQLKQFVSQPTNKGKIMTTGLWAYTRHPNYFGEAVMWWAIGMLALVHPIGIIALVSPMLITYLLRFVSGVPLLEKKYANNPEFLAYASKTSIFFPLPPKRS